MKNIHIHRDTYYISFSYKGKDVFALVGSNEIDMSEGNDKECVLVNAYGIPYACDRRELLSILKEDASTNVKQFTADDYLNDNIPEWEASND